MKTQTKSNLDKLIQERKQAMKSKGIFRRSCNGKPPTAIDFEISRGMGHGLLYIQEHYRGVLLDCQVSQAAEFPSLKPLNEWHLTIDAFIDLVRCTATAKTWNHKPTEKEVMAIVKKLLPTVRSINLKYHERDL